MSLESIENTLKEIRSSNPGILRPYIKEDLSGITKRKYPLQPSVISKIENGENYFISSLFNLANAYGCKIKCNDSIVSSCSELGQEMIRFRNRKGLSQVQMTFECGFKSLRYAKMEKGQLTRQSLVCLLSKFPDFKLELIY